MRRLGLALFVLALLWTAPAGAVELHAHRGGTLAEGTPVTPENSMTAFERAHELGMDKIEIDVKLTADRVPVIMHDATLDRTTDCEGLVRDRTAEELEGCHIDIRGTSGNFVQLQRSDEPVPTLAEFLAWAVESGAGVNLELKNVPTDIHDFDVTPRYVETVLAVVQASRIKRDKLQIQSFWPPDVDAAQAAGYKTSLLTLQPFNEAAIAYGLLRGHEALGPQWPSLTPVQVDAAHAAGLEVIPYTLNAESAMREAQAAGVDGVISDDPVRMRRVLRAVP